MMDKLKEEKCSLQRASWASDVSKEALDRMLEHATFRLVSRNSSVFHLRGPSTSIYGLLSRRVRMSIPAETGNEFILTAGALIINRKTRHVPNIN